MYKKISGCTKVLLHMTHKREVAGVCLYYSAVSPFHCLGYLNDVMLFVAHSILYCIVLREYFTILFHNCSALQCFAALCPNIESLHCFILNCIIKLYHCIVSLHFFMISHKVATHRTLTLCYQRFLTLSLYHFIILHILHQSTVFLHYIITVSLHILTKNWKGELRGLWHSQLLVFGHKAAADICLSGDRRKKEEKKENYLKKATY